jgi:uncharacterized protein YkwD
MAGRLVLVLLLAASSLGAEPWPQLAPFRTSLGLPMPAWDPLLARSATQRATVLAEEGALSHQDSQGRGPGSQMAAEGLPPGVFGEVLAAGRQPEAVWASWLASPTHREVLTHRAWTRWGAGSAPGSGTTVWVVRFWGP